MEDEEARSAARLRDCQISRDLPVWALELNHCHLSHRRDGRVADSTLEPTLERTPHVDAASEDPKDDGSDSNTRLPHSTIRRSSRYSVKCRRLAVRWCEESGLLKAPPPMWLACP